MFAEGWRGWPHTAQGCLHAATQVRLLQGCPDEARQPQQVRQNSRAILGLSLDKSFRVSLFAAIVMNTCLLR